MNTQQEMEKNTTWKFEIGDILIHRASGEKVVVINRREERELQSSVFGEYTAESEYIFVKDISDERIDKSQKMVELVFEKYVPQDLTS